MRKHSKTMAGKLVGAFALVVVVAGAAGCSRGEAVSATGEAPPPVTVNAAVPAARTEEPPSPAAAPPQSLPAAAETPIAGSQQAGVHRVDPTTVCMVNDRAMGKPQIPIEVDQKTYYGCCEMCKQRLAQDDAVRYAVDPVTGQRVDKASAVIAERPDGSVLYFTSADTLGRFGKTGATP